MCSRPAERKEKEDEERRRTVRGAGRGARGEGVAVEGTRTLRVRASVCACASLTRRLRSAAGGERGEAVGGGGRGAGGERNRRRRRQQRRPGRVEHEAEPGQAKSGSLALSLCATLGQAPTSVTPTLAHPRRYLPRALFLCRSYAHAPLAPSTDPQQSHSRGVLSPSAFLCLPACLPVGRLGPAFPPATPCSDSRALSPLPAPPPAPTSHQPRLCIAGTGNQHTSRPIAGC